jgi:hypothetical protein
MNWEQLKTIFWLRWRLLRNQWSRSRGLGAVIAFFIGFGALFLAGIAFTGALLGAAFGLHDAGATAIMGIWALVTAVFLFLWMFGLLNELQRSEMIDLQKLMHLPVALGQLFVVNYLVSHFSLSIVVMVPLMLGLTIGLVISHGPALGLMIPLALSMVLMVTAWTYCLRGWLATMMSNPRRRHTIIMCITLAFVVLAQGPNIYFNVFGHFGSGRGNSAGSEPGQRQRAAGKNAEAMFNNLIAVQDFIPPFWVSVGAKGLAENRFLPALGGTLGCLALAALGLRRAYRGTVKFYRGEAGGKAAGRLKSSAPVAGARGVPVQGSSRFLEWQFPAVPEQSAALALATLRSLLRAPEVKLALVSSLFSVVVLGGIILMRSAPQLSDTAKPFAATGVAAFSIFLLLQFFTNQFGFDRDGFRSLLLSPADRRLILLGKNLAILPLGLGFGVTLIALVSVWLRIAPLVAAAALLQLLTLLLIASLGGNLLSILVPFRIQPGSLKPTKMPGLAMLMMLFCQLLLPLGMAPVFVGPLLGLLWSRAGLPEFIPVNFIFSALLCGVTAVVYWLLLAPMGRLLQRRETRILGVVTVEVE